MKCQLKLIPNRMSNLVIVLTKLIAERPFYMCAIYEITMNVRKNYNSSNHIYYSQFLNMPVFS